MEESLPRLEDRQLTSLEPIEEINVGTEEEPRTLKIGTSLDPTQRARMIDFLTSVELSHGLVEKLLHRFRDAWKSALGVFRWAESRSSFCHVPKAYDAIVDILGKSKQMERMRGMLDEMLKRGFVNLNTVSKVMRRFAGAGLWRDAVWIFDELENLGLEKNIETMNLLLDTLCKEGKVEQAHEIFLALKPHIPPDAYTFNIFIHGWCKLDRVDEALWTIQEMKGHGTQACVISYSIIIRCYCCLHDFVKVYELFDEMHGQGSPPNIATYSTVMNYLIVFEIFQLHFMLGFDV
ncbi:pentatricopeptide repeat-containing protein At3g04130, mitochondrial-like [Punica granatum]|uniref:Pentatricopeptide repeat-containing protein At3g04130, mitochondrial-like n=1 Tax=Punica granatum TaxID=22663 RepID=A0A6P8DM94_PUNGR|nr:pentatricopeptide repeat-containing protein At3g04130, mitochondrial-like [Punica granatum]